MANAKSQAKKVGKSCLYQLNDILGFLSNKAIFQLVPCQY